MRRRRPRAEGAKTGDGDPPRPPEIAIPARTPSGPAQLFASGFKWIRDAARRRTDPAGTHATPTAAFAVPISPPSPILHRFSAVDARTGTSHRPGRAHVTLRAAAPAEAPADAPCSAAGGTIGTRMRAEPPTAPPSARTQSGRRARARRLAANGGRWRGDRTAAARPAANAPCPHDPGRSSSPEGSLGLGGRVRSFVVGGKVGGQRPRPTRQRIGLAPSVGVG
jgi:hypothetical protein